MKAIVYTKYGPPEVLQLKEIAKPTPKDDEVLIRVHAASVNAYDWHFLTADIFLVRFMGGGLFKPKNPKLGALSPIRVVNEILSAGDGAHGLLDGPRHQLLDFERSHARIADADRDAGVRHVRHQVDRQPDEGDRAEEQSLERGIHRRGHRGPLATETRRDREHEAADREQHARVVERADPDRHAPDREGDRAEGPRAAALHAVRGGPGRGRLRAGRSCDSQRCTGRS